MQRSFAAPLALLAVFCLGMVCADRPAARTWAQDEDTDGDAEPAEETKPERPNGRRPNPASDKPPLIWERLNTQTGQGVSLRCSRSKVPGGWLVLVERVQRQGRRGARGKNAEGAPAKPQGAPLVQPTLTFLPDPGHGWDGGSPQ